MMAEDRDKVFEDLKELAGDPEDIEDQDDKEEEFEEPVIEETEEDIIVPETISGVLNVMKQDLKDFLQPMPDHVMKRASKLLESANAESIDFTMWIKELPILCKDIKVASDFKKKDMRNVESSTIRILEDFEKRAERAEEQVKDLTTQLKESNKSISAMSEKNSSVWQDRIKDLKEDPIRKETEEFLKHKIQEMKTAGPPNAPDITTEETETEESNEPPEEEIISLKEAIIPPEEESTDPEEKPTEDKPEEEDEQQEYAF